MAKLIYENELPAPGEFQKSLAEAMALTNPVDDLLELSNELGEFERQFHMSSADFYEKYQRGLLNDELQHCLEWATTYGLFTKTKRKLEAALIRAAVQPELLEPAL